MTKLLVCRVLLPLYDSQTGEVILPDAIVEMHPTYAEFHRRVARTVEIVGENGCVETDTYEPMRYTRYIPRTPAGAGRDRMRENNQLVEEGEERIGKEGEEEGEKDET
jgi:hypothetical protein